MIPITYNLRSMVVRKTTTLVTALGIALVVFVLSSALMLSDGIKKTMSSSGRRDHAIILRKGSNAELNSSIEDPTIGIIASRPEVKRDAQGTANGIGELVVVVALEKLGANGISNVQVRGVSDSVLRFRDEVKFLAGRPAQPGTDEVVVGARLRGRFQGVDLGQSFELKKNRPVKVVGIFSSGGSSFESEVWADIDTVRSSFGREGLVSSVRVRLESPAKFEAFEAAVETDKQLGLDVEREDVYYETQSEGLAEFVTIMGGVIAFFFSIGAMIGAMITMYASIAGRQREIGTLRALGFSKSGILISFLVESVTLAIAGAAIGAVCSLCMGFVKFSMINLASWSEIVFSFSPTVGILAFAIGMGGLMGLVGGFLPALRAASISPALAMRG